VKDNINTEPAGNDIYSGKSGNVFDQAGRYQYYVNEQPGNDASISKNNNNFKYLGQLFYTFILCEKNDCLYIIDQHAAHEKSIYEKLCRKDTPDPETACPYISAMKKLIFR
jgi:DNA mismatch repair ATPase MutL